ncbi:hypothetical protein DXG01_001443 [Tephrocybe rancida]|nr:hypothetical protein DXG01_001443 [Tephrocybe rancida]
MTSLTVPKDNHAPETLNPLSATTTGSSTLAKESAVPEILSLSSSTMSSTTVSAYEREVLTALSNTIGSLPPLPLLLDVFLGQLLPPPPSDIDDSGSTTPSQAKRRHDDEKWNPFVDLEAEEDTWDGADMLDEVETDDDFIDDCKVFADEEPPMVNPLDEGEEDEGLDVFLDNDEEQFLDNEHPPSARATSHKRLANHDDMEQWQSLLAHAHEWGRTHKLSGPSTKELKALPPAMLYRGYEETAAMVVGNKLLTAGTAWAPSVKSIFRCISCPTWIFIGSSNGAEVNKLCANLSNIYLHDIHPIVKDLSQYLREPFVAPKPGDWVCLNSLPLYRGDLAYVTAYNNDNTSYWVEGHKKDSGGQGANGRAGRPSKLLLEVKEAIRLFSADAVKVHNPPTNFTYLGNWYHDGFLYHVTHDVEPAVPTIEELALFQDCAAAEDIVRAQNQIASLRLKLEDRVIVTSGELLGMTGTITSISEEANEATVSIDAKEGIMDIVVPPIHLHKSVQVTDRVHVAGGAGDGRVGWAVAVNGTELHILEDKTAQPFKINVNRVVFHHDAQMFSEILADDKVSVELSTLKREVFHLSQLSNLSNTTQTPHVQVPHGNISPS